VDASDAPIIHEPAGCEECHQTGFRGRTAIVEILAVTEELDEIIATGGTRKAMLESALSSGFHLMAEDGVAKVLAGVTSLPALMRAVDLGRRR
jgi:type II secretory ATPase GspE/PulE/Tfp pilus assembly ATPase PilB-like protein